MKKKVVPKLRQEVKVDIVTSDDNKIYYTGKFQSFIARYIIQDINNYPVWCRVLPASKATVLSHLTITDTLISYSTKKILLCNIKVQSAK